MKEKIVFLTPQFKTGGGNRVFIELANKLVEQGYKVEILYPNNSKEKNNFNINSMIKIKAIGSYKNSKVNKLKNLILFLLWVRKNKKTSKIIISDPIMSIFSYILKGRNVYRFIQADDYRIFDDLMILKNKYILFFYKVLTKISYNYKFVKIIFNSKYVYDCFLEDSNRNDIPFLLVHPSINKKIFIDKNLISNEKKLNICTIARKHPLKGFREFLKCIESLEKKYLDKINSIFIISHDNLIDFNLKNKKYTRIIPKNDKELAEIYNKSDIFISTSWWEGFGLPALEAMACGCSVITSKSGGANEYAIDTYNCLMYEPKNVKELKSKLIDLIEDSDLRRLLSENSKGISENFSWEISVEQLKKILEEN